MIKDERQLRTTNNLGLVGYRAEYHGDRVIAIMKGNEDRPWQCLGIIHPEELSRMVDSGPCVNWMNYINRKLLEVPIMMYQSREVEVLIPPGYHCQMEGIAYGRI